MYEDLIEKKVSSDAIFDGVVLHVKRDTVELPNGKWGAFEAKLGDAKIPQAEKSLLRLREKVRANPAARNPDPLFLAVLAGVTPAARKLPSGVCVVPLTSLGA